MTNDKNPDIDYALTLMGSWARNETPGGPGGACQLAKDSILYLRAQLDRKSDPIPMLLWCPECGERHIDVGEFATKVHHTHACQSCGMVWRPAVVPTVGVTWLPGFKDNRGAPADRGGPGHAATVRLHRVLRAIE